MRRMCGAAGEKAAARVNLFGSAAGEKAAILRGSGYTSTSYWPLQGLGGLEDLVGAGADAQIAGEIDPAYGAGGIEEELGGARDVVAVDAGALVQEIVAANHFGIGVGEECIGVAGLAAEILRLTGRIDANGYGPDTELFEIRETFLDTP